MIQLYQTYACYMAEKRGFEPLRRVNDLRAFQARPFNHLGISPKPFHYSVLSFGFQAKTMKIIFLNHLAE